MIAVDLDPLLLHTGEDGDERAFQRFVNRHDLFRAQLGLENLPQAQGDVGILGGVFCRLVQRDPIERHLRLARSGNLLERNSVVLQVSLRQRVHAVIVLARIQYVRQQHRVINRRDIDVVRGEDREVVLDILPDLQDRRIFEHRFQSAQCILHADLPWRICAKHVSVARIVWIDMRERDVAGFIRCERQGYADKVGRDGIETVGLCVNCNIALFGGACDPLFQLFEIADADVFAAVDRIFCGLGGLQGTFEFHHFPHAPRDGAEFHFFQEIDQRVRVRILHGEVFERYVERHVVF